MTILFFKPKIRAVLYGRFGNNEFNGGVAFSGFFVIAITNANKPVAILIYQVFCSPLSGFELEAYSH